MTSKLLIFFAITSAAGAIYISSIFFGQILTVKQLTEISHEKLSVSSLAPSKKIIKEGVFENARLPASQKKPNGKLTPELVKRMMIYADRSKRTQYLKEGFKKLLDKYGDVSKDRISPIEIMEECLYYQNLWACKKLLNLSWSALENTNLDAEAAKAHRSGILLAGFSGCISGDSISCDQLTQLFTLRDFQTDEFRGINDFFESTCTMGNSPACLVVGKFYSDKIKNYRKAETIYRDLCERDPNYCYVYAHFSKKRSFEQYNYARDRSCRLASDCIRYVGLAKYLPDDFLSSAEKECLYWGDCDPLYLYYRRNSQKEKINKLLWLECHAGKDHRCRQIAVTEFNINRVKAIEALAVLCISKDKLEFAIHHCTASGEFYYKDIDELERAMKFFFEDEYEHVFGRMEPINMENIETTL